MGKHQIAQPQMVNTKMNYAEIMSLEYFKNIHYWEIMEPISKLLTNTREKYNMLLFTVIKNIYVFCTYKTHREQN